MLHSHFADDGIWCGDDLIRLPSFSKKSLLSSSYFLFSLPHLHNIITQYSYATLCIIISFIILLVELFLPSFSFPQFRFSRFHKKWSCVSEFALGLTFKIKPACLIPFILLCKFQANSFTTKT